MDTVLERIAAWQAAGLIDAATADRLRAAEPPDTAEPPGTAEPAPPPARHSTVARRPAPSSARRRRSSRCSATSGRCS